MKITKECFLAAIALVGMHLMAEELPGNCLKQAQVITPKTVDPKYYSLTLLREWDPEGWVYNETTGEIIQSGDWLDPVGGDTDARGIYYCKITVKKGERYLLWTDPGENCTLTIWQSAGHSVKSSFSAVRDSKTGTIYYYFQKQDWTSLDDATCEYIVEMMSENGRGRPHRLYFTQDDVPAGINPGSQHSPIPLTEGKTVTVEVPTDDCPGIPGLPATFYSLQMEACTNYEVRIASAVELPEGYSNFALPILASEEDSLSFHVDHSGWDPATQTSLMIISADKQMDITLAVCAYEPKQTTLTWSVVKKEEYAGTFTGTLLDLEEKAGTKVSARFEIGLSTDGVLTNYEGSVFVNGVSYPVSGSQGVFSGATVVGEKTFDWFFDVGSVADGKLSVGGSIYVPNGGDTPELLTYEGELSGKLMDKKDSFLQYDEVKILGLTAKDLGITSGAFSVEGIGSETLVKLYRWAKVQNVSIGEVSQMTFGGGKVSGDPDGLLEEAYLLGCAPEDVEDAKVAFCVTSFDPTLGRKGLSIAGGAVGATTYGNGSILVLTADSPSGPFAAEDKVGASAVFFRAKLVK